MCNIQSKLIFHAHHEVGFQKCVRVQAKVFCIFSRLTLFAAGLKIMAGCVFNTQKSLWFFWCLDRSYENRGHFGGLRVGGASKRVKCMIVRVWVWHCSVARSRCYRIYSTICLVQKKIYKLLKILCLYYSLSQEIRSWEWFSFLLFSFYFCLFYCHLDNNYNMWDETAEELTEI